MTGGPFPTIGRIVHYRSRTGTYTGPAMVVATEETLAPAGVEAGHVPPLSSTWHVHLVCFTPGKNVGGTYQEFDIPPDHDGDKEHTPGTWRWPARV